MSALKPHIDLLGRRVRDRVSGFEGVVTSLSFDLYGCIQVAVSPPIDKDGKIQPGRWMDVHRMTAIGDERALPAPNFDAAVHKLDLLGRTGRDRVAGLSGTIVSIGFELYGNVTVALAPPIDKDGKIPDAAWMDMQRVTTVGDERAMASPSFLGQPAFGATPQTHQHGPAEKPAPIDPTVG